MSACDDKLDDNGRRGRLAYVELLMVHLPETCHEQLVLLGNGEVVGEVFSIAGGARVQTVEIEQDVVEG